MKTVTWQELKKADWTRYLESAEYIIGSGEAPVIVAAILAALAEQGFEFDPGLLSAPTDYSLSSDNEGLDVDASIDFLADLVHSHGDIVFHHSWIADGPASSGADNIYKLGSRYFAREDESRLKGPYDSLDEALANMPNTIFLCPAEEEFRCTELTAKQLAERLKCEWVGGANGPKEHRFTLNSDEWVCRLKGGETKFTRIRRAKSTSRRP